jgi:hypothetical protein
VFPQTVLAARAFDRAALTAAPALLSLACLSLACLSLACLSSAGLSSACLLALPGARR